MLTPLGFAAERGLKGNSDALRALTVAGRASVAAGRLGPAPEELWFL